MGADCAFVVGKGHRVCEDYARSGKDFVVITDGCSSSPDTDVGARLLNIAACDFVYRFPDLDEKFHNNVLSSAWMFCRTMGLPEESIDATLLVAHRIDMKQIRVSIWGDGYCIARKRKTKELMVYEQSYPDQFPLYLSYGINVNRYNDYLAQDHGQKELHCWTVGTDGSISDKVETSSFLSKPKGEFCFPNEVFDLVVILSDGINSFFKIKATETSKTNEPISANDVIKKLLAFKNLNGAFVQRRLNGFFSDVNKCEWQHSDDVSLGAVFVG